MSRYAKAEVLTCSKTIKPNELKVLSSSPNDETFPFLNLMNSMQTSNSLYGDDYSCFTYCYVKGAVLKDTAVLGQFCA